MSKAVEEVAKRLADNPAIKAIPESPLPVHQRAVVKISVAEMKEIVANNPSHPVCISQAKGIEGLPDNMEIYAEKVDVLAAIENKSVRLFKMVNKETGETLLCKELGDSLSTSSVTTQSKKPKEP